MKSDTAIEDRWVVIKDEELLLLSESIARVGDLLHDIACDPHGQVTLWERKGEVAAAVPAVAGSSIENGQHSGERAERCHA